MASGAPPLRALSVHLQTLCTVPCTKYHIFIRIMCGKNEFRKIKSCRVSSVVKQKQWARTMSFWEVFWVLPVWTWGLRHQLLWEALPTQGLCVPPDPWLAPSQAPPASAMVFHSAFSGFSLCGLRDCPGPICIPHVYALFSSSCLARSRLSLGTMNLPLRAWNSSRHSFSEQPWQMTIAFSEPTLG